MAGERTGHAQPSQGGGRVKPGGGVPLDVAFLRELCGWKELKAGRILAEAGAVEDWVQEEGGGEVLGVVRAQGRAWEASLCPALKMSQVRCACQCRAWREGGEICEHIAALGWAVVLNLRPSGAKVVVPGGQGIVAPADATDSAGGSPIGGAGGWVPEEAATGEEPAARLYFSWVAPWEEWVRGGRFLLRIEVEAGTCPRQSWAAALKQCPGPWVGETADVAFAGWADAVFPAARTSSSLNLAPEQVPQVLEILAGHDRCFVGKEPVEWDGMAGGVEWRFHPLSGGGMATSLKVIPPPGVALGMGWWVDPKKHQVRRGPRLPDGCGRWGSGERVEFRKEEVPVFIENLWPRLRGWGRLEPAAVEEVERWIGGLKFEVGQGTVEMELDGSLETVSLRGKFQYAAGSFSVRDGSPGEAEERAWKCAGAGCYWCRDARTEGGVLREVREAGFHPSRSQPEVWVLEGNQKVMAFLADRFRNWRRRWSVVVGARLGKALAGCAWVEPTVRCVAGGGLGDWLSVQVEYGVSGGEGINEAEARALVQSGAASRRMRDGRMALVARGPVQELQEILFDCDGRQEGGVLRIQGRQAAYVLGACAAAGVAVEQEVGWTPPQAMTPPRTAALPAPWPERLRAYQVEGVRWLDHLASHGLGGVLADEMGLGKTVQILAWLAWKWSESRGADGRGVLVVCPTSVVANWEAEVRRFLGASVEVAVWSGAKRKSLAGKLETAPLVLTSYALLRRDVEVLAEKPWGTVILDEAQHIKNRFSQIASAVKRLRAGERFVLTGTPIENSVADLWALFDFLMPGYLGGAVEFRDRYEAPLAKAADPAVLGRLRHRVGPFVLRRTKGEVGAELPARSEQVVRCEMTDEQKHVYQALLRQAKKSLDAALAEGGSGAARMQVFTALTRLRQACCHLDLLPRQTSDTTRRTWKEPSCKVDAWLELMDEAVEGGHRVLVFSQFTSLLKILQPIATERGWAWCQLHGGMPAEQRAQEVRKFQEDATVPLFLISLKAGGVGLNLTGADIVVQWDPWWNPAVEEQAMARAHRLGQTRSVMGYRIIAKGTIEDKILEMQSQKRSVAEGILQKDAPWEVGKGWDWEQLRELLG